MTAICEQRLRRSYPSLPTGLVRLCARKHWTPDEVAALTDAEVLGLANVGPVRFAQFRAVVSLRTASVCNWVGEGVPSDLTQMGG